jgi:hypothetical protein
VLEYFQQTWEAMEVNSRFAEISPAIRAGIDNLNKWYRKADDTDTYFICLGKHPRISVRKGIILLQTLVLDPNVKLAYAEDKWDYEARDIRKTPGQLSLTECT